jgi:hypothetical protein
MFDPLVKKKQHAALSSPGTSLNAGSGTPKSRTESSSSKKKDKVGHSLPSGEVSYLCIH